MAPLRRIAPTVLDTIADLPYREAGSLFTDPPVPVPWVERSASLQDFPGEAAQALLAVLGPDADTQLRLVELRLLGGALERSPAVPNAVPGRRARWSLFGAGGGPADGIPALEEQLTTLVDAMAPWSQDEMMPNLLSARQGITPEELRTIYGSERYDRLAVIKGRYDPRNLFRMNHNIVPVTRS